RGDGVALGFRHLLAVRVEDPPRDRCVVPRQAVVFGVRPHHGGEQPGADDVVRLGAQVHREHLGEELVVPLPLTGQLRGERRRRPRVHDVGVAGETAGLATLVLGITGGDVDARVYGKLVFTWGEGGVVDDLAVVVQAVPDG